MNKLVRNESGAILIVSFMLLTILSLLATTVTVMTNTDTMISSNYKKSQMALLAAEAGIEYGRDSLLKSIRENDNAWNQILAQNSDGNSATATNETMYELNAGVWDALTLTNNTVITNSYISGGSGPNYSLSIKDNNDQDLDYTVDTDFGVILTAVGMYKNTSKTLEVEVSCPTCEDFYTQERYSPENPGSLSTQGGVSSTLKNGIDVKL